jgi:hypothetical protein
MTGEPTSQAEAALEPDERNRRGRIQYTDDVESRLRRGRSQRRHSADSTSVRGTSLSRRFSIDPATAIPIEYRTLYVEKGVYYTFANNCSSSFNIEESQAKKVEPPSKGELGIEAGKDAP